MGPRLAIAVACLLGACEGRIRDVASRPLQDGGAVADGEVPRCGNGAIDPGETCDGDCPTSCDDGNPCTLDRLTGSAADCTAACALAAVVECGAADSCCPAACTPVTDGDCSTSCGDGQVGPGETCDPAATCPASCDDGDACTEDLSTGSEGNCNASCSHAAVVLCGGVDGCCPAGCTSLDDGDCPAACGNGVVEAAERCDGDCPTSCDDGMACTTDELVGAAALCSAECTNTAEGICVGGNGCCPSACDSTNDADCPPRCGNGVVEAGETCDGDCPTSCNDGDACTTDGLTGSAAACTAVCSHVLPAGCAGGSGCCPLGCSVQASAVCDGAGAGEMCTTCQECDTLTAVCGNGACDGGETSASCGGDCGPASWPNGWTTWETEVLAEINRRRQNGDDCPSGAKPMRTPVTMNAQLRRAAQLHSWDQVHSDYFAHQSCNGRSPWDRAAAQGTSASAEIIAGGYLTPVATVNGWMGSDGHCQAIMGDYTEAGIGHAVDGQSISTGMFR